LLQPKRTPEFLSREEKVKSYGLAPLSFFLSRTFLAQNELKERIKTGLLILVCVALASAASLGVVDFWRHVLKGFRSVYRLLNQIY
jgi:hypothetical protein